MRKDTQNSEVIISNLFSTKEHQNEEKVLLYWSTYCVLFYELFSKFFDSFTQC